MKDTKEILLRVLRYLGRSVSPRCPFELLRVANLLFPQARAHTNLRTSAWWLTDSHHHSAQVTETAAFGDLEVLRGLWTQLHEETFAARVTVARSLCGALRMVSECSP